MHLPLHKLFPLKVLVAVTMLALAAVLGTGEARAGVDYDSFPGAEVWVGFANSVDAGGATIQDEPPSCEGPVTASIWAYWTATESGPFTFSAGTDGDFVPLVTAWEDGGDPGSGFLNIAGCGIDSTFSPQRATEQRALIDAVQGHTYFFLVGVTSGGMGEVRLAFERPTGNSFDNRAQATTTSLGDRLEVDLAGAGNEAGEPQPTCPAGIPDGFLESTVWLRYDSGVAGENVIFHAARAEETPWLAVWTDAANPTQLACGVSTVGFRPEPNTNYLVQIGTQGFVGSSFRVAGRIEVYVYSFQDLTCPDVNNETVADPAQDAIGSDNPTAELVSMRLDASVDVTCLTFTYGQDVSSALSPEGMLDTNLYIEDALESGDPYADQSAEYCPIDEPFDPRMYLYFGAGLGTNVAARVDDSTWNPGTTPPWATFSVSGNQIIVAAPTQFLTNGYNFRTSASAGNPTEINDCMPNDGVLEFEHTVNPLVADLACDGGVEPRDILPLLAYVGQLAMSTEGCPPLGAPVEAAISTGGTVASSFAFGDFNCDGVVDLQDVLLLLTWANDGAPPAQGCWDLESHVIPG